MRICNILPQQVHRQLLLLHSLNRPNRRPRYPSHRRMHARKIGACAARQWRGGRRDGWGGRGRGRGRGVWVRGRRRRWRRSASGTEWVCLHQFSKILSVVAPYSTYTEALTFENFRLGGTASALRCPRQRATMVGAGGSRCVDRRSVYVDLHIYV